MNITIPSSQSLRSSGLRVSILSFHSAAADEEGDVCPYLKLSVSNGTKHECALLKFDALLLGPNGQIIHHYRDEREEKITPGDTQEFEIGGYNFKAGLLGIEWREVVVKINVRAYIAATAVNLEMPIPEAPYSVISSATKEFSDKCSVAASVWKDENGSSKDSRVEFRLFAANKCDLSLQKVLFGWSILNKAGKEIYSDSNNYLEVNALSLSTGELYASFKDRKQLVGSKVTISVGALIPVADAEASNSGLSLAE